MAGQTFLQVPSSHSSSNHTMTNPMTYRVPSSSGSIVVLGRPIDFEHSIVVPLVVHLVHHPGIEQTLHSEGHVWLLVAAAVYMW